MTVLTAPRSKAFSRQLALPFGPAFSPGKNDTVKAVIRHAPPRPTEQSPPPWLRQAAGAPPWRSAESAAGRG